MSTKTTYGDCDACGRRKIALPFEVEIGRADLAHEINSVLDYLSEGVRVSESEACQWARSYLEAHLDELSEALGETVTAPLTDEQVISLGLSNADGVAQFKLEEGERRK